jgi:stage II sporulation protein M
MILGIFFGVFPIITIIINGYILGYVALATTNAESFFSLWRILPHGIFELPAVFISLGLGLKLGTFIFHDDKIKSLKEFFVSSIKVFLFIIVPLLIVAAVIEGALIFLIK